MSRIEREEVRVGMLLAIEDPPRGLRTESAYDLWAVKSVRKLKNGDASVTLIQAIDCGSAEATARIPRGEMGGFFRHWLPSRRDAEHIFKSLADPAAEKEPGEAQSTTRPTRTSEQGAVLSGHPDSPTGTTAADYGYDVDWTKSEPRS